MESIPNELKTLLEGLQSQLATLTSRIERLEGASAQAAPVAAPVAAAAAAPVAAPKPEISDDELLAISAALANFFGLRVTIRQIRLISTAAWAQEGRVSIQASHRLHN
jgi:methylmalonyl-CoA carboxyltransferase 12S subunit